MDSNKWYFPHRIPLRDEVRKIDIAVIFSILYQATQFFKFTTACSLSHTFSFFLAAMAFMMECELLLIKASNS